MLRPRLIPCLLIHDGGLVKSTQFGDYKYVGDPLNAVRIFNEKQVDELMIIDIDASVLNKEPNYDLIKKMALESRMPLCYGGGVSDAKQAKKIVSLGAEKVAISSAVIKNPEIILEISKAIGQQSVVVVLDIKKRKLFGGYETYIHNGKKNTKKDPFKLASLFESYGVGEIVLNSIDRDGMMSGYDLDLSIQMRDQVSIPMSILGGAGSLDDMKLLFSKIGVSGAAAGSVFVFKGKYRAVLINYPSFEDRRYLYDLSLNNRDLG